MNLQEKLALIEEVLDVETGSFNTGNIAGRSR